MPGVSRPAIAVLRISKRLGAQNFMELWARSTAPKSGTCSGIAGSDYLDVSTVMAVAAYFRPTLRPGAPNFRYLGDRCGGYCPDLDSMTVQCVLRDGHRGQHRDRAALSSTIRMRSTRPPDRRTRISPNRRTRISSSLPAVRRTDTKGPPRNSRGTPQNSGRQNPTPNSQRKTQNERNHVS